MQILNPTCCLWPIATHLPSPGSSPSCHARAPLHPAEQTGLHLLMSQSRVFPNLCLGPSLTSPGHLLVYPHQCALWNRSPWVPRCLWEQQLLFRDGTSCPSKCHALNTMPHTESLPMGHTCWAAGRGKKAQVWAGLPWTLTLARASNGRNCSSPVLCEPPTFLSPV